MSCNNWVEVSNARPHNVSVILNLFKSSPKEIYLNMVRWCINCTNSKIDTIIRKTKGNLFIITFNDGRVNRFGVRHQILGNLLDLSLMAKTFKSYELFWGRHFRLFWMDRSVLLIQRNLSVNVFHNIRVLTLLPMTNKILGFLYSCAKQKIQI